MSSSELPVVVLGSDGLRLSQVEAVARGRARLVLSDDPAFRGRLQASRDALDAWLAAGKAVYGVTTGFGASCDNTIRPELRHDLAANLVRFHGVGTGALLDDASARAVVIARAAALARGGSAVRTELIELLVGLVERGVTPCIPSEGSVGASGDLTPLSYIAAVLMGEREARLNGEVLPSAVALERVGLKPLALLPKESLALMNGTSVMTGIAALVVGRARRLAHLACALTGTAVDVLRGNPGHFDDRIFAAKPHPGQRRAAARMAAWLAGGAEGERIQDAYSLRCAPHVVGVLLDAIDAFVPWIETELNSVNDNPVVDPDTGDVLHGGNFYGGHIAFAMDGLKAAVASVADLLDRQVERMGNPWSNVGLPGNLILGGATERHGFKAMQIAASALTAEALKLTMPAASFSRSTESHNQDKVSMGTIAARDAARVVELTERVAAIHLLAVVQAVDLRGADTVRPTSRALWTAVRRLALVVAEDRRQDVDIQAVIEALWAGDLPGLEDG